MADNENVPEGSGAAITSQQLDAAEKRSEQALENPASPEEKITLGRPEPAPLSELETMRVAPAAHLAEAMAAAAVEGERGVTLHEHEFPVQIGLRAVPGSESAAALAKVLGFGLPTRSGEVTGDPQGLHVIWMSPDEFLVVDVSRRQEPGEAVAYEDALADGMPGQAVELSGNRTLLVLAGPSARAVLEKSVHLDLHPREFAVGQAAVTQAGLVPVILHRSGEQEWRLYPRASFADYLGRWLIDGMGEFSQGDPEAESVELEVRPA